MVTVPIWAVRHRQLIAEPLLDISVTLSSVAHVGGEVVLTIRRRDLAVDIGAERLLLRTPEFLVLEDLVRHSGCPRETGQLGHVASGSPDGVSPVRVREIVHALRRALGPDASRRLQTVRGHGYVWAKA